jgi:hypothetical protein
MTRPKDQRPKNPSSTSGDQIQKFREAAREHEADGSEAELDRYIKQVAKAAPKDRQSDSTPERAKPNKK